MSIVLGKTIAFWSFRWCLLIVPIDIRSRIPQVESEDLDKSVARPENSNVHRAIHVFEHVSLNIAIIQFVGQFRTCASL